MDVSLNVDATVALDVTGAGTIQLGPSSSGEVWTLALASVQVSTNVLEATCLIYIGDKPIQTNFVDGTFSGSTGDSTDKVTQPMSLGNYIYAVWSGGDAGSVASLNASGVRTIPG